MAEEPEQVLPQQRVAALGRVEEVRADQPVDDQEACCAIITAGMAKMIMKEVTSIAQTKSGMRLSDMPGARCLRTVTIDLDRDGERRDLGEGDHLRPEVGALARANSGPGERHVGEPADVRPDVQRRRRPRA